MSYEVTCAGCGTTFTAKSPRARWHTEACRKAAQRKGAQAVEPKPAEPAELDDTHDLVETTRRELTAADVVDTFHGQLALQLARRLAQPDESGVSSLSRELSRVMAAALAAAPTPAAPAEQPSAVEPETDEVAKARQARERKARNAARRA